MLKIVNVRIDDCETGSKGMSGLCMGYKTNSPKTCFLKHNKAVLNQVLYSVKTYRKVNTNLYNFFCTNGDNSSDDFK